MSNRIESAGPGSSGYPSLSKSQVFKFTESFNMRTNSEFTLAREYRTEFSNFKPPTISTRPRRTTNYSFEKYPRRHLVAYGSYYLLLTPDELKENISISIWWIDIEENKFYGNYLNFIDKNNLLVIVPNKYFFIN